MEEEGAKSYLKSKNRKFEETGMEFSRKFP